MFLLIVLTVVGLAALWYAGVRLLDHLTRRRVRKYFDRKLADLVRGIEEKEKKRGEPIEVQPGKTYGYLITGERAKKLRKKIDLPLTEEEKKREGEK